MTSPGEAGGPPIDPRHDAIYQRGYRPGESTYTPERRHLIGAPPSSAPVDTGRAGDPVDGLVELDDATVPTDDFHDELPQSAWNPFIVMLWVLGPLQVAGAVALQWQAATFSFANYSYAGDGPVPFGMLVQQLSYAITPSLLTAGFVTISGALVWHAAIWRARRLNRPAGD